MKRTLLLLMALVVGLPQLGLAADSLTFEKDIRPILKAHCFQCHGESGVREGALDVRLRRGLVAGGDSGPAVQPGAPQESLLLERVASGEMPPGEEQNLPKKDIALLSAWIEQGANTARPEPETLDSGDYLTEEERTFWSFQPIVRPPLPPLEDMQSEQPIDWFVLARLRPAGLDFSAQAERSTMIRRATFDLWGLPPSPEMVAAFVDDEDPSAYARLIDGLLASPRYGERWGRHWLDVAGYADSDGYTNQDTEREFAYFYRDYVIESFNANKPLDQFICEQLAGDEMDAAALDTVADDTHQLTPERIERLTATGFLRMAADGTASGEEDRALAANATIADTLDIVSSSLLGLTVGCARCHDHRYDPISQADYHRFRAIFEPALDWKQWLLPQQRRLSLYTDEEKQQREAVEARAKKAEAARAERQQEHIARTLYEELLVAPDEQRAELEAAFNTEKAQRSESQLALLKTFPSVGNITPGSLYLYAEQRARRASGIEKAADKREARYLAQAQAEQLAQASIERSDALKSLLATPRDAWSESQKQLAAEYPDLAVDGQSLERLIPQGFAEVQRYRTAAKTCREQDAKTELANLQTEISEIRSTAPQEKFIRLLTEPASHTPPSYLFIRGDHEQPGQAVEPGELTVLQSCAPLKIELNDPQRPTTGRRLAYARHLTSGQHPLLARVLMNRVWLHHFGRGIVDTPGDFGFLGATPTHPELLDWLADELMRGGWDLKRMQRMIMLSQTYQQLSARSEALDRIDPDNRLYARMSVRRLESEAIRDAMLSASGVLLDHMYGPPVPVKEDAVGQIVIGKEMLDGERKPVGGEPNQAGVTRRSVYVQVRRSRPLAVLETFDIATVAPNCTQRSVSNVALQSLLLMNSQFVIDQAAQLAEQLIRDESELSGQLSQAWLRCFGNRIDQDILHELTDFVQQQNATFRARDEQLKPQDAHRLALASACQAMFSSNEFLYVD